MNFRYLKTPIGNLLLAGPGTSRVSLIAFPEGKAAVTPASDWTENPRAFAAAAKQLKEYFAGRRTTFDLELEPDGTPFQQAVLRELQKIPYGETRSYGDIAASLGKPKAVRAVGAANGRNPLPIVIPCHRVVGANGSLTGFGGGIDAKRWLLNHEQQTR